MLVPGVIFGATGAVQATVGAATPVSFINQGFGFTAAGALAIDTDAPTGSAYVKGFRVNPTTGAIYGTTSTAGTDAWMEGIRRSSIGQLIYEAAAPTSYTSRNPITANGVFAIESV